MGDALAGKDDLAAIYIPSKTDLRYGSAALNGRVVGAVRLQSMPADKGIADYCDKDLDEARRWPIGWPCEVVFAPLAAGPLLSDELHAAHPGKSLPDFTAQFGQGPFALDAAMADRLTATFNSFERLR